MHPYLTILAGFFSVLFLMFLGCLIGMSPTDVHYRLIAAFTCSSAFISLAIFWGDCFFYIWQRAHYIQVKENHSQISGFVEDGEEFIPKKSKKIEGFLGIYIRNGGSQLNDYGEIFFNV